MTTWRDHADAMAAVLRQLCRPETGCSCAGCVALRAFDLDTSEEAERLRVDCPGTGSCHGCMVWCEICGDVGDVCDDPRCDRHADRDANGDKSLPRADFGADRSPGGRTAPESNDRASDGSGLGAFAGLDSSPPAPGSLGGAG